MSGPENGDVRHPFGLSVAPLAAWSLWLAGLAVTVAVSLSGNARSVTGSYRTAALNWISGQPIYGLDGTGFIYLPQAAVLWIPFAILPEPVGEVLWRALLVGTMAVAIGAFGRAARWTGRDLLIVSALTLIGCFSGFRNGQSTILMMGLMLLAACTLSAKRWAVAAVLLVAAVAVKPLAIVMLLLAAACYPRALGYFAAATAAMLVLPFLTQHPSYVAAQYVGFYDSSVAAYHLGTSAYWAQLFGMLKVAGVEPPGVLQTAVRCVFALATCYLAIKASKLSFARAMFYLYALSACFLMLFNPRTENSTYAMLAPVFAALIVGNGQRTGGNLVRAGLVIAAIATALSFELSRIAVPRDRAVWAAPLICAGLSVFLVFGLFRETSKAEA